MDRDLPLERHLLDIAARAGGNRHDAGLGTYRDTRPRADSWGTDSDVRCGLAIARDALLASLVEMYAGVLAGDPDVMDGYERHMRTLAALVNTWAALHTGGA